MATEEPVSRTEQVAADLRAAIIRGDYPRGSQLPSEDDLARRYDVARSVVNTAMRELRAEGLVRAERGRGTVVAEIPSITRHAMARYTKAARERTGARGAFDGEIRSLGMEPRTEVTVSKVVPPGEVAEQLGLAAGVEVIARQRKMYADNVPVQLATSYIPADIAEGTQIAEVDSGPGGIISRFAELGFAQTRITETIRWRTPTAPERAFLRLDKGQAVAEIWHTGWTAAGRAVEICVHVVPAWQWQFDYEWQID